MSTTIDAPAPERPAGGPLSAGCAPELAAVPPSDWDALLTPGSAPLSHEYLRAWERCELAGLRSRPLIARAGDDPQPVAACPGYLYDLDLPTVRWPRSLPAMRAIRSVWPRCLLARTYELGSPTPLANPFLVRDPRLRSAAVPALIGSALAEGEAAEAAFVLVQNFTSLTGPAAEELARLGFAGVAIPETAVVDLPYDSFEGYLAAMRAQYRRRAQQALRRSADLTAEHRTEFAAEADELARLWRAIYDRAGEVRREVLPAAFFREVSAVADSSVVILRRPDGTIASFGQLLSDGPWLTFQQCGFEAGAGRDEGAYFRLLYEIVRVAIEGGYEQVDLGITTLAPKLDVGAVPVPLYAWLRHRNPVIQRALEALAGGPLAPERIEQRRVFKDGTPTAADIVRSRGLPA